MRKLVSLALSLVLLLCLFSYAAAEPWRVFDSAELYTPEEEAKLEDAVSLFQKETNMDFVFLTTDDYFGDDQIKTGCFFWDNGSFGFGADASGVLYYIDMHDCYNCIVTTGSAVAPLEAHVQDLTNGVYDLLSKREYYSAASTILDQIKSIILSDNE